MGIRYLTHSQLGNDGAGLLTYKSASLPKTEEEEEAGKEEKGRRRNRRKNPGSVPGTCIHPLLIVGAC